MLWLHFTLRNFYCVTPKFCISKRPFAVYALLKKTVEPAYATAYCNMISQVQDMDYTINSQVTPHGWVMKCHWDVFRIIMTRCYQDAWLYTYIGELGIIIANIILKRYEGLQSMRILPSNHSWGYHHSDTIMSTMVSQITDGLLHCLFWHR